MRPRNLSGEGTVSEAGMWSTNSVVIRGSCKYSWISLVYSSSTFCGAAGVSVLAAAGLPFLPCARAGAATGPTARAHTNSALPNVAKRNLINGILPEGVSRLIPLFAHLCQLWDRPPMNADKKEHGFLALFYKRLSAFIGGPICFE